MAEVLLSSNYIYQNCRGSGSGAVKFHLVENMVFLTIDFIALNQVLRSLYTAISCSRTTYGLWILSCSPCMSYRRRDWVKTCHSRWGLALICTFDQSTGHSHCRIHRGFLLPGKLFFPLLVLGNDVKSLITAPFALFGSYGVLVVLPLVCKTRLFHNVLA